MCGHIWIVSLPTWRLALAHKIPQGEARWHRSGTGVAQAEEHQVLRWRSDGAQLCMRSAVCTEPRTARGDEITSIAGIALRDVQICFAS